MFSEKLKEHEIAKQNEIEQLEYNLELKHKKQIEFLKAEAEKSMQLMKQKLGDRERMISELEVKMSKFQSSSKKSNFNTTHGDEDVGDVVHQKMRLERLKEAYKSWFNENEEFTNKSELILDLENHNGKQINSMSKFDEI